METIGERLKKLRSRNRWTLNEVSTKLGLKGHSTYSNWEYDRTQPDAEMIGKLAELYGVKVGWLLTGKEETVTDNSMPDGAIPYDPSTMIKIPILGTVRAGEPILMSDYTEGFELVEPEVLRGRKGFVLRVKGDSMIGDRIYDGDLVVVICQEEVEPSEIAVVAVNGDEATLKRVKCHNGVCVLVSSNTEYEPMIYPSSEVHILGKVVRIIRDL